MRLPAALYDGLPPCLVSRKQAARAAFPILLVALVTAVAWYGQRQMHAAVQPGDLARQLDEHGRLRPVAEVLELVRSLQLVTVEARTSVESVVASELWRGTARATVTAPVRYLYGVDLARAEPGWLGRIAPGGYHLRLPRPERLATEVDLAAATEEVDCTGTRLRTRAGEYVLGLARRQAGDAAEAQVLPPERLAEIEQQTLEQVRTLLGRLMPGSGFVVEYQ